MSSSPELSDGDRKMKLSSYATFSLSSIHEFSHVFTMRILQCVTSTYNLSNHQSQEFLFSKHSVLRERENFGSLSVGNEIFCGINWLGQHATYWHSEKNKLRLQNPTKYAADLTPLVAQDKILVDAHVTTGFLDSIEVDSSLFGDPKVNKFMDAEYLSLRNLISSQKPVAEEVSSEIVNESEAHDVEDRKIMAVSLVREAIEKILLQEVHDLNTEHKDSSVGSDKLGHISLTGDSESGGLKGIGRVFSRGSEKRGLNHWSDLKKWVLLQRFIKEIDKVKEIESPNFESEAEKHIKIAPGLGGKKSGEQWMLDYALRQAIDQLAPTQKKKVSLLVKAFETMVPPQEESSFRIRTTPGISQLTKEATEVLSASDDSLVSTQCLSDELKQANLKESVEDESCIVKKNLQSSSAPQGSNLVVKDTAELSGIEEDISTRNLEKFMMEKGTIGNTSHTERTNNIKMWHMIYQHVVPSVAEKLGSDFVDVPETEESENKNTSSLATQPEVSESSNVVTGLTKEEVVKLIKETVNEILLAREDSFRSIKETEVTSTEVPNLRNWSKLKNLVLVKRSIKALEVARELKKESDSEADKVKLKSQMINERMKAEQWMLDYAVQHIVTKLTPARKQRVSMLVEAFEAVIPFPDM